MIALPSIARASNQMPLLKVAPIFYCSSNATTRNAYGMAAQEIACAALGLSPISTNGNYAVCFDAEKEGAFFEIKSVQNNGKVVVYDWRLKKEEAAGVPLSYVIVIHRLKGARDSITDRMLTAGVKILLVPFTSVRDAAMQCPLNKINTANGIGKSRNGYQREGYRDGYRNIPVGALLKDKTSTCLDFNFYGDWKCLELLK